MSTIELRELVEGLGGTFGFHLFDGGFTITASIRRKGDNRAFVYRFTEEWGDSTYATDRMYAAMVADSIVRG